MSYSVNLWGSHPKNGNDDCITGADFPTLEKAEHCAANLRATFTARSVKGAEWIEIDGPDHNSCKRNPDYVPSRDDDSAERSERAMQAGMAFGVQGYNDAMGYDSEPYDPAIHDPDY
jgi:hypothetical protein